MPEMLLDSVILIDHFNGLNQATQCILALDPDKSVISVITRAEILVGFSEDELDAPKALLDQYKTLTIDKTIADKAASLQRQQGWKLPDAFQAALAIKNNLLLLTRNTKDFDPGHHPFVRIPYQLV
jgi:hypothetical protein